MQPEAVITASAPAPVGPYNQAVKAGGLLYCSGQIALDPATGLMVGAGDVEAETLQVLSNLQAVLEAGGSSPGQVLRTTVFLADLGDFARVNAIYAE
ncbi:MAG: Rid family detoxifying hydrolase, partial [Cyanobium sp. MAG_04]|nr:Rid family detoxifying hydrolase [Cyanobium sp. MAG_04]